YEKLGFIAEYDLVRVAGLLPVSAHDSRTQKSPRITSAAPGDYQRLCELDRSVVGADRKKFLLRLFQERPEQVHILNEFEQITGYLTARPGSEALQIGPCVAAENIGVELLADAVQRFAGRRVILDLP